MTRPARNMLLAVLVVTLAVFTAMTIPSAAAEELLVRLSDGTYEVVTDVPEGAEVIGPAPENGEVPPELQTPEQATAQEPKTMEPAPAEPAPAAPRGPPSRARPRRPRPRPRSRDPGAGSRRAQARRRAGDSRGGAAGDLRVEAQDPPQAEEGKASTQG